MVLLTLFACYILLPILLIAQPTGHTLRMLQLPPFLLEVVSKLKSIRRKTGGGGMTGGSGNSGQQQQSEEGRLDRFEKSMINLQDMLHNPKECEFTVVTIPTELATAESGRLLQSLQQGNIAVRRVIINQVLPSHTPSPIVDTTAVITDNNNNNNNIPSAADVYLNRLRQGQTKCLNELNMIAKEDTSSSASGGIPVIQVPYFDMEVRTVYGLRTISSYLFPATKTE